MSETRATKTSSMVGRRKYGNLFMEGEVKVTSYLMKDLGYTRTPTGASLRECWNQMRDQ